MIVGPLSMFQKMNPPSRRYLVAAWHWAWSVTWSWAVYWSRSEGKKPFFNARRVYRGQGFNFDLMLRLPVVGEWHIVTQPSMRKR